MAYSKRKLLSLGLVLAMIVTSALFALGPVIGAHAQSALAAGITSATDYYVPGSNPWGTAFDGSGRVWVALPGCDLAPSCASSTPPGKLALFNPNSQGWSSTVSLPAGYGQPLLIAVDHNGKVWFTMPVTNSIGMYDPSNTTVTQWSVPTASAGPWGIAVDSKGIIWFTEHYGNQIGSFDPSAQTFHEIATPASNSLPYGITVDASDNIWFAENNDAIALIGEYTNQHVLKEYKIRNGSTSGLTPHMITVDPNNNVWWSEGWVHSIGMLNVAAAQPGTNSGVTEYPYSPSCGNCGSHTSGISAGKQGLIWLNDSLQNTYGSFPIGGGSFSFYSTPSGGHPHDGLNVDAQNRVWFNEEFANKLAVAIPTNSNQPPTSTPTGTATSTPTNTPIPTPSATLAPGSTLGTDSYQRANQSLWGVASDGQTWGGDANTQSAFTIAGNVGVISNTGGSSYSAVLGPQAADAEVYATSSITSFSNSNFGNVLRYTDNNNWYKAFLDGSQLYIQKKVAGATTLLTSVPFVATAGGTSYSIHFRAVGSTLSANVWASAGSEPAGWMTTITDTSLTTGFAGMRFLTQSGKVTVTSFQANVFGAGSTPTPTSTVTATATPTVTPTPSATPTPGAALGTDSYQRANQSLWGVASDGQTWGGDANTQSTFTITGNAGVVSNTGGSSYSAVLGPQAADTEVYATGSITSFSNSNFGNVLRWMDGNNWYKAFLDGSQLYIQKKVAGVTTILTSTPFVATAGTSYSMHFRVVGSTLSANVWASSGSEPAGWMVTTSDTSFASGFAGVRVLTQSGKVTITSFQAKSL